MGLNSYFKSLHVPLTRLLNEKIKLLSNPLKQLFINLITTYILHNYETSRTFKQSPAVLIRTH